MKQEALKSILNVLAYVTSKGADIKSIDVSDDQVSVEFWHNEVFYIAKVDIEDDGVLYVSDEKNGDSGFDMNFNELLNKVKELIK